MDVPSSSNVTGRRKRTAAPDRDSDLFPGTTPLRKVRGTKQANPNQVVSSSTMQQVNRHADDIINNKKVGATNCFEYKSPLEMYGIQKMLEANASITEMAVVLESAQIILAYRVDRLHHDVRQVDSALSSGDISRGNGPDDVHVAIDNRKARKKMAITDGMNGMTDFLNQIDDVDYSQVGSEDPKNADFDPNFGNPSEEERNAGVPSVDLKANSKDVDEFTNSDLSYGELIKDIAIKRAVHFHSELCKESSQHVSVDETAHDIKDSSIDWLKTNPTFQKATKGSLDNTATSFHSLNHFGLHSPSGRTMILHPRIQDKHADDQFFVSDVTLSLANNTRALLENSLAKKPSVLDNYLMLEVRDRPVIGRYKIMAKEVKKSTLPLAEASRERDLANLTFAEMNRVASADMTMAGTSDISMLPGNRDLPLSIGDNDAPEIDAPSLNHTASTSPQSRIAKDEYVPPNLEALALEEALIGKVDIGLRDMDDLEAIFDAKMKKFEGEDALDSKIWKNGLRAEEWGDDDETSLKSEIRNTCSAGVDGWIKATDSWTNYDIVKMPVNRETKQQLEESALEEQESYRNLAPEIGKNLFLVKSDEYKVNYPNDRFQEYKMAGEDLDVMKMAQEEDDEDVPLEQIKRQIQQRQNAAQEVEAMDDFEYDAGAVNVDFDDRLAAPADDDDLPTGMASKDDGQVPQILFGDHLDEQQEEVVTDNIRQRQIEDLAFGADEVAELMTASAPEQTVGPSAEQREEIRNIGKTDNAHWVPPELADRERTEFLIAQRKRKDKKTKGKRVTVEDYAHYFRELAEDELERETTAMKCEKIADEKSTFLTEQQVYLPTLGTENKPYVALDLQLLTSSGLFFKKHFGKLKVERVTSEKSDEDIFAEELKGGNKDSDCLNWLLSFGGFCCMENPEPVNSAHGNEGVNQNPPMFPMDEPDYGEVNYYDDEYDRFNPRLAHEAAAAMMGPTMQKKLANFSSNLFTLQDFLPRNGEYGDSDDEFDDSFDRQNIQAKNLDAAKHKKCLADILNNDTLSMPCIQYALEQLTVNNQTLRQNNTTIQGPSTSERDATMRSPTPLADSDTTLMTVFDYHSPNKMNHDVNDIIKALTDMTDFEEEDPKNKQTSSSKYGTANTENRKVKINGFHTLLSLALSMPPKMGESVKPSSIVSFILHVANENSLKIVQDRSKRSWMSDFVVLNQADQLPSGLKIGRIDETDDFWKKTQDPDAIEGSVADEAPMFASLMKSAPRPKAIPVRKVRTQRGVSPMQLGSIEEDDEDMEAA